MAAPTRTDRVTVPDGSFDLHVWVPEAGGGPGVLLLQEIYGVGAYIQAVAARLAALGYVAAAPDVFWRVAPGWASTHDEDGLAASMQVAQRFDAPTAVEDCIAALGRLRALPEVRGGTGVLGFCLGGTLAHLVAAGSDPDVVVSYYGSGVPGTVALLDSITCPALYHFGGADPYIPRHEVDAVVAAAQDRPSVEVHVFDAGHAFDNHEAPMFHDPDAAAAAWDLTVAFLRQHLPLP